MSKIHRIVIAGLLGTSLAVVGCDSSKPEAKKEANKDGDAKKADARDGGPAGGPADLAANPPADGGADGAADEAPEPLDARVVKAAGLAKKIDAEPSKADEILAEAGMDRESFEALIYEVSTPELAEQYRLAMARES